MAKTDPFIDKAMRQFKLASDAESEMRREALDDWNFRIGKQWPKDVESQRQIDGRPCLTMNRAPQFLKQVTNEQRQQRPAIQVNPVGDDSDTETAKILQGIIRHIEVNSGAERCYEEAGEQMATGGFGYFEVNTKVVDDDTNEQEIIVKRIQNPFMVYFDPSCQEPDKSDAMYAFKVFDLPIDKYRSLYPDSDMATMSGNDLVSIGDMQPEWASKDTIRVAEYWRAEGEGNKRKVYFSVINAIEKLSETEWPSKYIGIVPVMGDDLDVNGKRYVAGLIRNYKDPQRMYNYWISAATETIALAPKSPFIIAEGQIENREVEWAQSNRRNTAVLQYKPQSIAGAQVPPPQRQTAEPPIAAMVQMTQQADRDMKATTGIYDASLGERGPEESAKAILARQKQSDVANLNFSDNIARSIEYAGKIILDLIPKIYDVPRIQRIIHPDKTIAKVGIYNSKAGGSPDDLKAQMEKQGIQKIYDIGVGRYDVTISVGPSYETKRQEAVSSITALVNSFPSMFPIVGDLLIENMDWPNSREVADRLKKMLPPQLQQGDDAASQAGQLQTQLQQLTQQHQQLTDALNQAQQVIDTKQVEMQSKAQIEQMKIQGNLELEKMKIEAQIAIAEIETKAQAINERIEFVNDLYSKLHDNAHEIGMQAHQQAHEKDLAAAQAQQSAEQQASQQQHEQDLAEMPNTEPQKENQ